MLSKCLFNCFFSSVYIFNAVNSYTLALRNEVGCYGIKVCAVLPGDVKTDFTAKREKNVVDSEVYGERIQKSVAVMEHDEQNGYPPIGIAKAVYKLSKKKNPPVQKVGGAKYAMFVILAKFLPKNFVNAVVGKLYA